MGQLFINGTQYAGVLSDAKNISCGVSGLSATTVQAALSELSSKKIQADWSITDSTANGYVLNKPAIKSGSRSGSVMIGNNYKDDETNLLAIGANSGTAANIFTVSANGQGWFKNGAYVGGSNLSEAQKLATLDEVSATFIPKTGTQDLSGDLVPILNNAYELGTSDRYWGAIYVNNIQSSIGRFDDVNTATVTSSVVNCNTINLEEAAATITYDKINERIVFSFA